MKIETKHPNYPRHVVRRAAACLLAHSLLSQVEYHLQLASMKGVR